MPDARFPFSSTGPGRSSSRTDLDPSARLQQPQRIVQGGPYGSSKEQEQMQAARPLQNAQGASAQAVSAAARTATRPQRRPNPNGAFAGGGVSAAPKDMLAAISAQPSQFPGRPVNYGVVTGTPRVQSTKELLGHLEGLMQGAETVPENVVRLYNRLRAEASAAPANAPRPYQSPPVPQPGQGRPSPQVSPNHPIVPAQPPAPPPAGGTPAV